MPDDPTHNPEGIPMGGAKIQVTILNLVNKPGAGFMPGSPVPPDNNVIRMEHR